MTERERRLRESLSDSIRLAEKAAQALQTTYDRIGGETAFSTLVLSKDGRERLDTLTSRFARLADLLTQQVFRLQDRLEYLVEDGSLIDRLNHAEKRGWIDSTDAWKQVRELRNRLTHEYTEEIWFGIVRDVYQLVPTLLGCVTSIRERSRSLGG